MYGGALLKRQSDGQAFRFDNPDRLNIFLNGGFDRLSRYAPIESRPNATNLQVIGCFDP